VTNLGLRIVRLSVSSRVDNETESPMLISDRNMETAWSSKTGELEGAWVEMHVSGSRSIKSLLMTVGMTKKAESPGDPDLFLANPRIEEIALSWTPIVGLGPEKEKLGEAGIVVERVKLDVASRDLQPIVIPTPIQPPGILRVAVKKVQMGKLVARRTKDGAQRRRPVRRGRRRRALRSLGEEVYRVGSSPRADDAWSASVDLPAVRRANPRVDLDSSCSPKVQRPEKLSAPVRTRRWLGSGAALPRDRSSRPHRG
jgi:hypothetical protein